MKIHFYLVLLALYYLTTCYACNKGSMDDTPPPNPIDTTTMTTDTTASDTIVYEDAPIWLPGEQRYGHAKGKKNGKDFEASVLVTFLPVPFDHYLGMSMGTYTQEGYIREIIDLSEILTSMVGKYEMNGSFLNDTLVSASYNTALDDGDVAGDRYIMDTLATTNCFEVTYINMEERVIEGKFTVSFNIDIDRLKKDERNPDYCVFEDIEFKCKIVD